MYTESVLLESRSARSNMSHGVEVLDKVKALALSADGVHATTRDVAEYFEVGEQVVYNLHNRHREELANNGLRVLQGSELHKFVTLRMSVTNDASESHPQMRRKLAVYTRRTVLKSRCCCATARSPGVCVRTCSTPRRARAARPARPGPPRAAGTAPSNGG